MTWVDGVMGLVIGGLLALYTYDSYEKWDVKGRTGPFLQHWFRHMGWIAIAICLLIGALFFYSFYDYAVGKLL